MIESARELFIHPNTLRQRLGRIEELTGLKLDEDDLLSLELAIKLARLHGLRPRLSDRTSSAPIRRSSVLLVITRNTGTRAPCGARAAAPGTTQVADDAVAVGVGGHDDRVAALASSPPRQIRLVALRVPIT